MKLLFEQVTEQTSRPHSLHFGPMRAAAQYTLLSPITGIFQGHRKWPYADHVQKWLYTDNVHKSHKIQHGTGKASLSESKKKKVFFFSKVHNKVINTESPKSGKLFNETIFLMSFWVFSKCM